MKKDLLGFLYYIMGVLFLGLIIYVVFCLISFLLPVILAVIAFFIIMWIIFIFRAKRAIKKAIKEAESMPKKDYTSAYDSEVIDVEAKEVKK